MVEVTLESRLKQEKAQAFWAGDVSEESEGEPKEVWVWLPLSQITVTENQDLTCTVEMPEWLAKEKELI